MPAESAELRVGTCFGQEPCSDREEAGGRPLGCGRQHKPQACERQLRGGVAWEDNQAGGGQLGSRATCGLVTGLCAGWVRGQEGSAQDKTKTTSI